MQLTARSLINERDDHNRSVNCLYYSTLNIEISFQERQLRRKGWKPLVKMSTKIVQFDNFRRNAALLGATKPSEEYMYFVVHKFGQEVPSISLNFSTFVFC